MKIGIIIHSHTGNTYTVAIKLQEKLLVTGHLVDIKRLIPVDGEQSYAKNIRFEKPPDIEMYDVLVFGGPVRGASISPVLAAFLTQIKTLERKTVACLVTQFFPCKWMGGTRAIGQMSEICKSKGAIICGSGIVNWMSIQRDKKISDVVEKLSGLFSNKKLPQ